jgi:hypothetical protein
MGRYQTVYVVFTSLGYPGLLSRLVVRQEDRGTALRTAKRWVRGAEGVSVERENQRCAPLQYVAR